MQVAAEQLGYWQSLTGSHVPPGTTVQTMSSGVCVHPPAPHPSRVQATSSSQSRAMPGAQLPLTHVSVPLQTLPSSHSASPQHSAHVPSPQQTLGAAHVAVRTQVAPSQVAAWHRASGMQVTPSTQVVHWQPAIRSQNPSRQPSVHIASFGSFAQTPPRQASTVQGTPSSQSAGQPPPSPPSPPPSAGGIGESIEKASRGGGVVPASSSSRPPRISS